MTPSFLQAIKWILKGRYFFFSSKVILYLNSINANTFTKQVKKSMLGAPSALQIEVSDKLLVRSYVSNIIGESFLPELFATATHPSALARFDFPQNFALKTNHGSGGMLLVSEKFDDSKRLTPLTKYEDWRKEKIARRNFSMEMVAPLATKWLSQNYYWGRGRFPEPVYNLVQPRILVEELLFSKSGETPPPDYKFFMIHGICRLIQVDEIRYEKHTRTYFDKSWNFLNVRVNGLAKNNNIPVPIELDEMLLIAQRISEDFKFIRVDLYVTSNGIKFGELTNYPGGGAEPFKPREFDKLLGKYLTAKK